MQLPEVGCSEDGRSPADLKPPQTAEAGVFEGSVGRDDGGEHPHSEGDGDGARDPAAPIGDNEAAIVPQGDGYRGRPKDHRGPPEAQGLGQVGNNPLPGSGDGVEDQAGRHGDGEEY